MKKFIKNSLLKSNKFSCDEKNDKESRHLLAKFWKFTQELFIMVTHYLVPNYLILHCINTVQLANNLI